MINFIVLFLTILGQKNNRTRIYGIAIEGEKEEVDSIYEEVNKLFGSYLI